MKIEIEIPDWAAEQCIRILSGVETVAFKHVGDNWKVKTSRCARCGKCCEGCEFLEIRDGIAICGRGLSRPFHCIIEIDKDKYPFTNTEYKYVQSKEIN